MGEKTGIEWCDHTFNPWWVCTEQSPGCTNCYAKSWAARFGFQWGRGAPRRFFGDEHWNEPLKWDRAAKKAGERRRVFCASMADWADPEVSDEWRDRLFDLALGCTNLDWLFLTKCVVKARDYVAAWLNRDDTSWTSRLWLPNNFWMGCTTESQIWANKRIPTLLLIPARIRFVSYEPALGPIDLWSARYPLPDGGLGSAFNWGKGVHWVIAGGESGPKARPSHPDWFRSARDECKAAGVPFFFKQQGEYVWRPKWGDSTGRPKYIFDDGVWVERVGKKEAGRLLDGVEWSQFPEVRA